MSTGWSRTEWGHKEIFGRKGSYHMASLERWGINRYIGTWRLEGWCHIRPIADARSSNSNCRIKHHITSLFVPSCRGWLQNSDPPPCNLKAGLANGTWDKYPEALCAGEQHSVYSTTAACLKGTWQHQTSALPWLVFQYQEWHNIEVTQGLKPSIPQDSHCTPQELLHSWQRWH